MSPNLQYGLQMLRLGLHAATFMAASWVTPSGLPLACWLVVGQLPGSVHTGWLLGPLADAGWLGWLDGLLPAGTCGPMAGLFASGLHPTPKLR